MMMEHKHTPGPWIVGRAIATTGVMPIKSAVGRALIAHVTHPKWGYEDCPQDVGECEANAALISAAPDLLAALEAVMQYCATVKGMPDKGKGRTDEQQAAYDAARAAIAKARGQA